MFRVLSLSIQHVSKQYKGSKEPALNDFTLEIEKGILGILGPNGAGKSTLMRIIATITKPSQGNIFWNGVNILKHPNYIIRLDIREIAVLRRISMSILLGAH